MRGCPRTARQITSGRCVPAEVEMRVDDRDVHASSSTGRQRLAEERIDPRPRILPRPRCSPPGPRPTGGHATALRAAPGGRTRRVPAWWYARMPDDGCPAPRRARVELTRHRTRRPEVVLLAAHEQDAPVDPLDRDHRVRMASASADLPRRRRRHRPRSVRKRNGAVREHVGSGRPVEVHDESAFSEFQSMPGQTALVGALATTARSSGSPDADEQRGLGPLGLPDDRHAVGDRPRGCARSHASARSNVSSGTSSRCSGCPGAPK